MGNLIQMVPITPGVSSLFITDFNLETDEISYKFSRNPQEEITEVISMKDEQTVNTTACFFNSAFIQKFVQEENTYKQEIAAYE